MSCFIRRWMPWNTGMSPCSDLLDPSWKWRVKQSIFLDQSLTLLSLLLEELRHLHNLCKTLGRCMRLYSELYCWFSVFCFLLKMNFQNQWFQHCVQLPWGACNWAYYMEKTFVLKWFKRFSNCTSRPNSRAVVSLDTDDLEHHFHVYISFWAPVYKIRCWNETHSVGMRHTVLEPSDSNGKDGERKGKTFFLVFFRS